MLVHGQVVYRDPYSLYCFHYNNPIRVELIKLVDRTMFDHFITMVILVNSVLLGMRDFSFRLRGTNDDIESNARLEVAGKVLSVIFMCECVLKILAYGFVCHKTSYLRDSWNWLDFVVVIVSIFDFLPQ